MKKIRFSARIGDMVIEEVKEFPDEMIKYLKDQKIIYSTMEENLWEWFEDKFQLEWEEE